MAKENVKVNQVDAPTLFIGVGGTGCNIVQKVAEMCRPGETDNISFVCLDTNVNDLSTISKSKAKIYYVQTSNTQTVGDYLSYDEDALKNWFPKNAVIYDKTVSEGAGQVRAISRLALNSTIKTGHLKPLYDAIDDLFRKDGRELKQALRIVMASTSSGGTGSGIILPLAMYIRDHVMNKYPNTSLIVRSLILLPETLDSVIDSSVERDSQRRNAYATIKEINAFMMKGSGFLDVESDLKRYGNIHLDFPIPGTEDMKSLGILPFDFCFLMDGQDAEDTTLVNIEQYKRQAAQALYEQNIGPMQKNAFSVEDNIIKEMSNPGNYGRNRFGAIGASVVAYPYEDIADYVAYDWVIDSIGGEGEAAKWSRYDKKYQVALQEGRKKDLSQNELPKLCDIYINEIESSKDKFTKDLHRYTNDAHDRVDNYIAALNDEILKAVRNNPDINNAIGSCSFLQRKIDYANNPDKRGQATAHLGKLRNYERLVTEKAEKLASNAAEAIFRNETKTINAKEPFYLESLMRNTFNEIAHPNAMRYMLYLVKRAFTDLIEQCSSARDTAKKNLQTFSQRYIKPEKYDARYTKDVENTLDQLCAVAIDQPTFIQKMKGCNEVYDQLNSIFPNYYGQITKYSEEEAKLAAYRVGLEYVDDMCKQLEKFFNVFKEKVETLSRKKDDLVDRLVFHRGDSIFNVCSSAALLEELSRSTKNSRDESQMLDNDANASIFDAIKKNIEFEREIRAVEVIEEDKRIDIFDDVLVEYFRNDVRRKCADKIDLNIIDALALETRLLARIKTREENELTNGKEGKNEKVFDKVTNEDCKRHILETIAMGQRLAAPSVQRMRNIESREITLCAYNRGLTDMRTFRVHELMPKGNAVESISKYEIHFFNALYNLTPDKLNKFAAPRNTETTKKKGGLYHNAYVTYAKDIGPDSTKGAKISTHIDKRWDNISIMPELDFTHQANEMMRIHQAVVYGLVYNAIRRRKMSMVADDRKVYKYYNSEERYVTLAVSNNTPCDEFYEIVDSMYISPFIVSDLDIIKAKRNYKDRMHHASYEKTEFKKAVDSFTIEEYHEEGEIQELSFEECKGLYETSSKRKIKKIHDGSTSLFEIPVFYYASLPNNKRFNGEISGIVDAIIKTFEDELMNWEDKNDVKFKLCDILEEQYHLLMENYRKYPALRNNLLPKDNPVIDIIVRKITQVIESTPEPSDYVSMIEKMKEKLK